MDNKKGIDVKKTGIYTCFFTPILQLLTYVLFLLIYIVYLVTGGMKTFVASSLSSI